MALLTKYFFGDQIKGDEMHGACSTHSGKNEYMRDLVEKPEIERPLG
jgi:hypothetical protein